ncbi:MinD/ParA family ATP-binding protein [Halapricum desulfuricans]|uniref:FleN family ATPase involved in flagellar biosynthesis n=1 Tax=Halapricum desulfuricans TaxID=2841257 RepID=A0A897NN09_9EURY|nr:AAA family ATPase [Halapricum desulfuricans]QSG09329.1 FleN family ATPase involved in flagellar biosynthesis [Halapricum desulfuricans]QSG12239.1 FleN family ATPase involved in flagellar biosynthesis [Halapricum desulfuricans]
MTGHVFTIAGGKGGVGKTTTAVNAGVAMEDAGYDVVIVDADLGMANLAAMLGIDHDTSLHEVLAERAAISDTLTEGPGGVTLVPGEQSLEAFADADPAKLRKVIKTLANAYDVVLIDTGAGLSHEATVPLGLADSVLLVTTPDSVAIGDAGKTAQLAQRVDGEVIGTILTRAEVQSDIDEVEREVDYPLLAVIPEDTEATTDEPLVLNFPDSPAANAYRRLSTALERVLKGETVETIVEEETEWFPSATEEETSEDDDGDRGGVLGLFGG